MRIGIDARFFGTDGGIARYVTELVSNFQLPTSNFQLVLFLKKDNFDKVEAKPGKEKILANVHWYGLGEQMKMPRLIRAAKIDLIHFPHWNVPLFYRGPFVLTLHDLILRDFPTIRATTLRPLVFVIKYLGYRLVLGSAIQRAKKIIVPSAYVRERLAHYYPGAEKKAVVIYEGVSKIASVVPTRSGLPRKDMVGGYLLYVGNAYPHKNLERLMRVWSRVRGQGSGVGLVLVGDDDYFYKRLKKYVDKIFTPLLTSPRRGEETLSISPPLGGGVRGGEAITFFGKATDEELASLYAHARAVVVPSLSEGFGLPGLEAMSAGVPVVAARASCLPEIYGDAALWFDPTNEQSMVEVILKIMTDENLRQALQAKGREQVKRYSWERAARETVRIYDEIASSRL